MARKQTRKSVSLSGNTYLAIKTYCERHCISMSSFVEQCIEENLSKAENQDSTEKQEEHVR